MAPILQLPDGYQGLALRTPTLPPAEHTNCYVIGHHDALVVDPGSAFPAELARLGKLLYRLRGSGGGIAAVLLTHHHADHVGGAAAIARTFGVPIAGHPRTLARLPPAATANARRIVEHGQRFTVDPERELEAILTPGHADGHLCLFERGGGTLLAGDMVPGLGTTLIDPPEGDMARYLGALGELEALAPARILPSHGPVIDGGRAAIARLIEHRLMRERRVLGALGQQPRSLDALMRQAYSEVGPLTWSLATRSTLAHLIKLESEGRARRAGDGRWATNADP